MNIKRKDCVVFSSCCSSTDTLCNIIKQILQAETLCEGSTSIDDMTSYNWTIDNKYYEADVDICVCPQRTIGDQEFAESVQAIVLHFDANVTQSFDIVKAWIPFINLMEPSVRILTCDVCNDSTEVSFTTVQSWCIDHSFELVELVTTDEDNDYEEGCGDVVGVARIKSALEAHSWPSLNLKVSSCRNTFIESFMLQAADLTQTAPNTQYDDVINTCATNGDIDKTCEENKLMTDKLNELNLSSERTTNDSVEAFSDFKGACCDKNSAINVSSENEAGEAVDDDEMTLLEALGNDDPGPESFEIMFTRLKNMKDKADKLSDEDRKAYAEKVALTFWRAVGGDESEIVD